MLRLGVFKKKSMRKFLLLTVVSITLWGCGNSGQGQLVGVQNRPTWFQPDPYGMLYIPKGSYNMGPSDQDLPYALNTQSKTVSVQAFYMDQTEITNNEYRQFVYWVRDSIARRILGETVSEEDYLFLTNEYGEDLDIPQINWHTKIRWDRDEVREALEEMYYPPNERFYGRKEFDTRKYNFEYYWIDLRAAARKENRNPFHQDRSVFIKKGVVGVYPDTLAWIHDFTYSYNEPMTQMYFHHPAFDDYPVVGVNWVQAKAFCIWRTQLLNSYLEGVGEPLVQDFRLPTESEWEYGSRGGLELSPYPWGGPYIRNSRGCFLGNFKPMRGNYIDDGGFHTVKVFSYSPNDYGLYCMAGNVAEWTGNAYDPSSYSFMHDLNPDYQYDAQENDPAVMKRKVIRGGSWKDIGYFLQTGTKTYEYQDTAKCYIGFRSVMTYLGRAKGDDL